jgi:hypothetical protein
MTFNPQEFLAACRDDLTGEFENPSFQFRIEAKPQVIPRRLAAR